METKGGKMLRNVEMHWIFTMSPVQLIMAEYPTLLVKMGLDMTRGPDQRPNVGTSDNFDLLTGIEMLLSLACFIPLQYKTCK